MNSAAATPVLPRSDPGPPRLGPIESQSLGEYALAALAVVGGLAMAVGVPAATWRRARAALAGSVVA